LTFILLARTRIIYAADYYGQQSLSPLNITHQHQQQILSPGAVASPITANKPPIEEFGCTQSIRWMINPCVCKDMLIRRSKKENSTSEVVFLGTWLLCIGLNLDDQQVSRILSAFLSSEVNQNMTRRINLQVNQLTKIPREISRFKRLQKALFNGNKITSLSREDFNFLPTSSSSFVENDRNPRLYRYIDISNNPLHTIEPGTFDDIDD